MNNNNISNDDHNNDSTSSPSDYININTNCNDQSCNLCLQKYYNDYNDYNQLIKYLNYNNTYPNNYSPYQSQYSPHQSEYSPYQSQYSPHQSQYYYQNQRYSQNLHYPQAYSSYTQQIPNNYEYQHLFYDIEHIKKDLLQLKMLYNIDSNDVKIANSYIDNSIKQINKINLDIKQLNEKLNKHEQHIDNRMNNAYKKIYNLEGAIKLKKNKIKDNENDTSSDNNSDTKGFTTKIIKINDISKPSFIPLLGSMLFNSSNETKKENTNELIDSEDEYDDAINVYSTIENLKDNDIIEINIEIKTLDELIELGNKYKAQQHENNKDDIKLQKKIEPVDEISEITFKKIFNDLLKDKLIIPKEIINDNKTNITVNKDDKNKDDKNKDDKNKDDKNKDDKNKDDKNKDDKNNNNKNYYIFNDKKYTIDINKIINLVDPLTKLKRVIGMTKVKSQIIDMILYYIQNFENNNSDMLHTCIEGPPGVGKTKLGRILAQIYSALDIIPSKRFLRVRRTDLIGKYLGHTAHKTQEIIDEAEGGVLFIDEAYSLGDNENRDSFSKECIDTINQNLTEKKKKLIVIIAGYSQQLDKTFFALNEGLKRRFPFRFTIDEYNEKEMTEIFYSKIRKINWRLNNDITKIYLEEFFKTNKDKFKHYGGDIETLIMNCKMTHASRVIGKTYNHKKIIIKDDLEKAYDRFINNKKQNEEMSEEVKRMFC